MLNKYLLLTALCIGTAMCPVFAFGQASCDFPILTGSSLGDGLSIGLNTSDGRTDWLSAEGSSDLVMRYPGAPSTWGAVFITVGPAVPTGRQTRDMSAYQTLVLDISGDPGTSVNVGIKDFTQPDDGTETKIPVSLGGGWQTSQITLAQFAHSDLKHAYVLIEFVFGGSQPQTVRVRNVRYSCTPAASTKILPWFDFGGGYYSALYFTNTGGIAADIQINFNGNDGTPLQVPSVGGSAVTRNLASGASTFIEALNTGPLTEGYATVSMPSAIVGYAVFRQSLQGFADQEAVVPLSSDSVTTSTLIWDETDLSTALSMVNPGAQDTTVSITVRDMSGKVLGTSSVPIRAKNKIARYLKELPGLGLTTGRGSADFTVGSGSLAVIGIRCKGSALTSIPTEDR